MHCVVWLCDLLPLCVFALCRVSPSLCRTLTFAALTSDEPSVFEPGDPARVIRVDEEEMSVTVAAGVTQVCERYAMRSAE